MLRHMSQCIIALASDGLVTNPLQISALVSSRLNGAAGALLIELGPRMWTMRLQLRPMAIPKTGCTS